jgi:amino acid adenylation domain-containing protein
MMEHEDRQDEIAVVGMSCRFPGARDTAEYWRNLCEGVESIRFFSDDELLAEGISPEVLRNPSFVPAHGTLDDLFAFDAPFFGVSRREAQALDPQHRVFMECAWSALEDAGVDPARFGGSIGVYGGSGFSPHLAQVMEDEELSSQVPWELVIFSNSKDFLTTRVSYKLGLHGPSVAVQTACSTSLVAIHLACQSLLNRECDLALAGGATIWPRLASGYLYHEGGINSPDGHVRPFDARSAGMVVGSGAGVVTLKRMVDALRDGDSIHAVVKGSAINNDGAGKIGFTAPSVQGQARVIAEAVALAGIEPCDIGYVETHGTATPLGDPIEVAALKEVFGPSAARHSVALGAAKSNVGHLDTAAGVAGFIKAVLAVKHGALPPTLHFQAPNPETGLDDSPFYVNAALRPWDGGGAPRRAGVSSFGIGGTNAHAVLEEAPALPALPPTDAAQLVVLSARNEAALERMRANLAAHLARNPDVPLADVAYTLQEGRAAHGYRWAAAARDVEGAKAALAAPPRGTVKRASEPAPVAFLFPGQGTQHPGMARELYAREPVYRAELDRCAAALEPELGMDLRAALFPAEGADDEAAALLRETRLTQPALFATEYALAKLWMSRGVSPEAMLGHSIGEYVAACLAGVFTLENALRLVAARGRLMQSLPAGAMLAVPLPEAQVAPLLPAAVSLAAVNSAAHCVVSGETAEIDAVEKLLAGRDVAARRLHTSHAFHSAAMEPILARFGDEVRRARPAAPSLAFLSNVTGDWITAEQATDPGYWVRHLRETVRFADGVARLLEDPRRVLLEVGPGETLGTFARRTGGAADRVIVRSLPRADGPGPADLAFLDAAGALWAAGVAVDWSALRGGGARRKVALPTYPFDRTIHRARPRPAASPSPAPAADALAPSPPLRSDAPVFPELMQPPVQTETIQAPGRESRITAMLTEALARMLGTEPAQVGSADRFLALGADSLLLMQFSRTVESTFGVRVPFRRLLEELATIGELAAHLDHVLAADVALPGQPEPPAPAPRPAAAEAPAVAPAVVAVPYVLAPPVDDASGLQGIFAQQLAIIQTQLAMLGGAPAAAVAGAVIPAAPAGGAGGHAANGSANGVNGHPPAGGNGANGHGAPAPAAAAPSRMERVQTAAGTAEAETPASHGPHRPVSATLGQGGGYDAGQIAYFESLVRRYTARTRRSREYAAEHRAHLSDNRASLGFRLVTKELMYPIVGERSEGTRLWDVDGNEYVDFTLGFGVHFFGHRPPFIVQAVEDALRRGFHTGPQSDLAGPVARLFSELTGMERVTFCNTGSEAVMTALRVARAVTGRDRVMLFESAYHGCFDGILARPGAGGRARPIAPGTPQGMVDDVVLFPYGSDEALEYLRAHGHELAAVMVEPIQSNDPEVQPREFLHQLRALTRQSGTAFVFDETITGLRMGLRGAQGFFGVEADLATYGKVIGGGMPIGVLAGSARYMDAIDGGPWSFGDDSYPAADQTFFAGTFCKHPAAMAAAHAVLVHLKARGQALYDELDLRARRLVASLRAVLEEEGAPIRIVHAHSSFRFVLSPGAAGAELLFYHLLERGVYVWEGRGCFLSTAHTDEDCDTLVRALRDSLRALRDAGFMPPPGGGTRTPLPAGVTLFPSAHAGPRAVPLTPAQRQIWVHAQFGDDASRAYNEQLVMGLRGRPDADALRAAVADLVAHHESLRTVFDPAGEVQHVLPALDALPVFIDPSTGPADPARLRARMAEAVGCVFDLAQGPLFRLYVHANGPGRSVLQVVVHHIAADGLSMDLLGRDLETAYRARLEGRAPMLPPAMQLSEYARLYAAHAGAYADREAAWLASFQGARPTALPYDRPRGPFPTNAAGFLTYALPEALTARVRELGRRQGTTPFMTLVAGLLATLHRVTGQDDLVLGISSSGRPFEGSESLVAHCVEVLPIRSRAAAGTGAQHFLRQVRGWLLDAYEHEVFTWGLLHEKRDAPRDPSAAPLIAVEINMEPAAAGGEPGATPRFGGMEMEAVDRAGSPFTRWDIHVDAVDTGRQLVMHTIFNADLLDGSTVERLLGQVERVLEQVAAGDDVPLGELELLGDAERRRLLDEWNRTDARYAADACVHRLFEARAARTPAAVALVCEDEQLTYAALNARANRLAHRLRGLGVGPDVPVATCFERGAEMIVGVLGILKAGGAYVALDTALPAERLAYMLADSGAAALVTRRALADRLPAPGVPVLCLDEAESLAGESAENPAGGAEAAHLAYLVYTSGSTGRPKGVAVEHRQLANYLFGIRERLGLEEGASYATVSTLSADLGNTVVFSALAWGGTLHVLSEKRIFSGDEVAAYFARHPVDCLKITPSHLSALQAGGDPRRVMPRRWLVLGGEASALPWVDEIVKASPSVAVFNHYGPTETTIGALTYRVTPDRPDTQSRTLVLGRPLPNYQAFVVDAGLRPVPVGAAGELLVGGAGVARGYLRRPELTAERFVASPFGEGRLYRTGDRCRLLPDGSVEFLGRMDDQVKIRGFRVEPGEVAAVLCGHEGVREAVVAVRDDAGTGEPQLVAYVVGTAGEAALREHLRRTLPEYMVPSAFVALPGLPLNANGKVDRAALPAPAAAAAAPEKRAVAPRTPVEEVLAGVFCQVLGVEQVSVHDDFFALGGHSLKATRVCGRARSILGVPLKPRDLFEGATVAKLAARVEAIRAAAAGVEPPPPLPGPDEDEDEDEVAADAFVAPRTPVEEVLAGIFAEVLKVERVSVDASFFDLGGHSLKATRVGARARAVFGVRVGPRDLFECPTVAALAERVEAVRAKQLGLLPPVSPVERGPEMPLSFAQERLWFLDRLQPGNTVYSRPLSLRLRGALNVEALERALAEVVRRHEVLRTVYAERDGVPVQIVRPAGEFTLPLTDLGAMDEDAREAEARQLVAADALRPWDLAAGPVFRASLLRLAADDHVLLTAQHHIVHDGWSLGVMFGELRALYGAFAEGRTSPLPELRVQYADYAAWQRRHVAGEVLDRQVAWWKERLQGAPALLELPTDFPRPAVPTHGGVEQQAVFGAEILARLNELARAEGATLYMVLLAAFQVLLAKYAGTDDVVVGSPIAGRTSPEIEGLIGFFVNTLALRTRLDGDPTFRQVLGRVRENTLGAYENQEVPFEKLVEVLAPERTLSYSPLFQVMFTLANGRDGGGAGAGDPGFPGVAAEYLVQDTGTVKFDLALHCGEAEGRLYASLGYSTELFRPATAMRMLDHLERVLDEVSRDADVRLSRLGLLGDAERGLVVESWNATGAEYPRELCAHQLFEAQAERTPHAVAVVAEAGTLTYAGLNARANRLAHHLMSLGVGPDVRVGICTERGAEMAVGVLAVLKAGGAYVPLDPDYPADRLRHMVEDSAPAALLAHGVSDALLAGLGGDGGIPVVRFETDADAWAGRPETNPARTDVHPEHLVYVIYTSGSTGRPKGVMNHHGCLVNRLAWGARAWGLTEDDVLLGKTSLSFDGHIRELFLPWSVGARVVMARPGGHRDPDYLLEVIRAEGVTLVNMNASMLLVLLENPRLELCTGLRQVLSGGEALPGAGLLRFHERLPGTALHNLYGPSEAATAMMAPHCGPEQARATVPIGRPTANSRVYLLDPAGNPVPVGVVGELYVGGHSVGRGYLDRPALTAERFGPDPFGTEPGARLYRTGDLGRWLPDGSVEFLGRNDFQVKVRGFRIELGEVEARLCEHPRVREAAVLARADATGENRLVAWYTGGETVDVAALRAHLAERLPDYMVPAAFVRMEGFPLTPSAKLDRAALPEPEGDAFATRVFEAPVGGMETAVAQVWAGVLGVERVGRWDHFFELGGHSLRAVQVVSRVRQALGIDAALGDVFLRPVLADFARGLGQDAGDAPPAIERVSRDEPLAVSFAQQRLWFLERMGSVGTAYNVPLRLRLRGALDRGALARALDRIVERHEALRTVFAQEEGEPLQRILPAAESGFALAEHDLADEADAGGALRALMAGEAGEPFDLERGPVIRGRLVRMAADDHVLLLTLHHIASDAWSVSVLVNELGALYRAFATGAADPLPPLPVQYADYAAWQRRWLDRDALQVQVDYWKGALAGAPELLELPTDHVRPARQEFAGGRVEMELDEALTQGLTALSQRHGTTLFTTVMAAWAAVLGRLSGQPEVVVGTPSANRTRPEIEGLIGFFINTLALRVDLGGAPTVARLLERVKARSIEAQQHQDIPFERVVELVQPARTLAHSPLFQVVLAWQNTPGGGALDLPGLTLGDVDAAPQLTAKYDLSLGLQEHGGRIVGGVTYATSLFEGATVERWMGYLRNVLAAMAADDARPVHALPMLGEAERTRVVDEWNRTERAFPRDVCLHELFAARAAERPDDLALEWEGDRLTYAQLDERANRLANFLVRQGVRPDARVGVLLERGTEMIVSLLAILKAGGAYFTLDPAYPAERLRLMLADAGAPVAITRGGLAAGLESDGLRIVSLDDEARAIARASAKAPGSGAGPDNLAYVVYTSGSTGTPKGVMVTHRNVVQLVVGTDYVSLAPGDRVAQASNASFDAIAFETWGALVNGATLVGVGRDVLLSPPALRSFLRDERITTLYQTTALLNQLSREQPDIFAPLREVLFGGQAVDADGVRRILAAGRPGRMLHMYGPTETTAWSSYEQVERVEPGARTVSVGRATGNQRVYLLDAALHPVPVGVHGEAFVGGEGVVRGYLDRPALTAGRFVPDPFSGVPGSRMYRTGDRLKWTADGRLEFVGRMDDQVKIRGFRIEPGEVESVLTAHPGVREARVIVREDTPGEPRLVAYVVGEAGGEPLRAHLRRSLPEYMVPGAFVALERLPLTPNGKLDVKALPAPAGGAACHVEPRTAAEQALAQLWREVLRVERVGAHDDFFQLGGHSLLIMRLIVRVQDAFGVELSIRTVFAAPTLEAMAGEIERMVYEDVMEMDDAQAEALAEPNPTAGD